MQARVRVGDRWIGDGESCFIIAEAGSNHDGNLEQARALIDVAARAGADAIKFQVFRASRLYPRSAGVSEYLKSAKPIYDIIAEMEMPYEWIPVLAGQAGDRGLIFLASVFDEESVERLEPFVPAFKVASYELTHLPLIRHVAERGKPVILSTGTADLGEVAEAVEACAAAGNEHLVLMQCTAAYPAPVESLNVRAIATMKAQFRVPVGLSDHSRDPVTGPIAAVAVGANALEKHFTLSNDLPGPDHRFALEPSELTMMVRKVQEAEQALGSGEKVPHPVERELRAFARRSVFAIRDIRQGEPFTTENVAVLRCGQQAPGVPPREFPALLGRRARKDIPADRAIQRGDYV